MDHISKVSVGSHVDFPEWKGERHYMLPFTVSGGLPKNLGRFQKTIDQMMEGVQVGCDQECYIMIDEKEVFPGNFHRRPGLHVDGYWLTAASKHGPQHVGSRHGGHIASCHGDKPYWSPEPTYRHRDQPLRHRGENTLEISPMIGEAEIAQNYTFVALTK